MTTPTIHNRPHPAFLVAAAAVTAFALAGIGVLTGIIPSTHGTTAPPPIANAEPTIPAIPPTPAATEAPRPATAMPETAKTPRAERPRARKAEPTRSTSAETSRSAPSAPVTAICRDCGVIESVREIVKEGDASGVGAVAGGVLGAVLGNQVGGGRGKSAATVLGGIGGAVAGHQIEKSRQQKFSYEIVVRFDDGTSQVLTQETPPAWRQGDRVKMANGMLTAD